MNLLKKYATFFFVSFSTTIGHKSPDKVPTPFEMPMRIPAYRGAMSKWFTLNPIETIHYRMATISFIKK